MNWGDVQPYAIGGALAAVAYVLKSLIFDAITNTNARLDKIKDDLQKKIDKQGTRFGSDIAELKEWRAAVEGPEVTRSRRRTGAVPQPIGDDGGKEE